MGEFHPSGPEKSKGLVGIKVAKSIQGDSRCFFMIKEGGVIEDFSAKKCLDAVELNPPYVPAVPKDSAKTKEPTPAGESEPVQAKEPTPAEAPQQGKESTQAEAVREAEQPKPTEEVKQAEAVQEAESAKQIEESSRPHSRRIEVHVCFRYR